MRTARGRRSGPQWRQLLLPILVAGCAHATVEPVPAEAEMALDVALFRVVLENIGSGERSGVDPRPLRNVRPPDRDSVLAANPDLHVGRAVVEALVPSDLVFPDSADLAPTAEEATVERRKVLVAMGLREVDYFSDQAECPGLLVPPGVADRSECPATGRTLIILTEPRPTGSSRCDREEGNDEVAPGHWSITATIRSEGPRGVTITLDEFLLGYASGRGWEVVDRINRIIVE